MFKEIYFREIDAYLSGNMTDEERQVFEKKLIEDLDLASELEAYKQVLTGIEPIEKQQLRQQIGNIASDLKVEGFFKTENDPLSIKSQITSVHAALQNEDFFKEEQTKIRKITPMLWVMAAAASVLLLVAVGYWLFFSKPKVDYEAVASRYFVPEKNESNLLIRKLTEQNGMAAGSPQEAGFLNALKLYQAEKYTEAIAAFENYTTQYGKDADVAAHFYTAISLLNKNEQIDEAIRLLTPLAADVESGWSEEANWYLALAKIKNKKYTEGVLLLKKIAAEKDAAHQNEAHKLLSDLGEK